jgi:hypothetical protein
MKPTITVVSLFLMLAGIAGIVSLSAVPFGLSFQLSVIGALAGGLIFFYIISRNLIEAKPVWKKIISIPMIFIFLLFILFSVVIVADNPKVYNILFNAVLNVVPKENRAGINSFPSRISTDEWRTDIEYIRKELPRHHAYLFLHMKPADFYDALAKLEASLGKLSDKEISYELCRIVSMVRDGHTQIISVIFNMPPFLDTRLYPLRIFFFNDGVYVTDGGRDHSDLKGFRISAINSTPVTEIFQKLKFFIPGENENYKMQWAFPYILNEGLLKYVGIVKEDEAEFSFVDATGNVVKRKIHPVLSLQYLRWFRKTMALDDVSGRGRLVENYWSDYNKESGTVFLQINQMNNQPVGKSIKEFAGELSSHLDTVSVSRVIVDMRNCNGGDNSTMAPLINLLSDHPKINREGVLYALIGRQTFSAGISFVAALERSTKSIFVGEPSGSGPNQCGDVQSFILPNSQLIIQVSSRFHQQSFSKDNRMQISPAVKVTYDYKSWKDNIDPAIKVIADYSWGIVNGNFSNDTTGYSLFEGVYEFDADNKLEIKREGGKLVYEITGFGIFAKNDLIRTGESSFTAGNGLVGLDFINGKENELKKISIKWGNGIDTLKQIDGAFRFLPGMLQSGEFAEAGLAYRKKKRDGIVFPADTEAAINKMGYKLLQGNKVDNAILLFALNTDLFPSSGNTWDSLAEAWLKKGDKSKARIFYRKSLEMNPGNVTAMKSLNNLPD